MVGRRHIVPTTIDRSRLDDLLARELERFERDHPRSRELFVLGVLAVVMMAWGRLGWAFLLIALLVPGTLRTAAAIDRAVDPDTQLGLKVLAGMNVAMMGLLILCVLVYWRSRLPRPTVDPLDGSMDEQRGPVAIADTPETT